MRTAHFNDKYTKQVIEWYREHIYETKGLDINRHDLDEYTITRAFELYKDYHTDDLPYDFTQRDGE